MLVLPLYPTSHYCAGTDDEKLCLAAGQTVIVCDSVVLLCSLTQSNEATAAGDTHCNIQIRTCPHVVAHLVVAWSHAPQGQVRVRQLGRGVDAEDSLEDVSRQVHFAPQGKSGRTESFLASVAE